MDIPQAVGTVIFAKNLMDSAGTRPPEPAPEAGDRETTAPAGPKETAPR